MAAIIYKAGVSGKTVNRILSVGEPFTLAIGIRRKKDPLVFRWDSGKRVYLRGIPPFVDGDDNILLRYGWRGHIPEGFTPIPPLGEANGYSIAANKLRFRTWATENKVTVPRTWVYPDDDAVPIFPCVHRPKKHAKGRDFVVVEDFDGYDGHVPGYCQELISKEAEFRVYVFNGLTMLVARKYPAEGVGPDAPWNFSLGNATFKMLRNTQWERDYCKLAMKVCHKLGLLFAGVDIIYDGKKYYVCEVNTAPSLQGKVKPIVFSRVMGKYIDYYVENEKWPKMEKYRRGSVKHPWAKGGLDG